MSEKVKQYSFRYTKDNLNEYEKMVITALNDWHAPQLRNVVAYTDKVNPNACVNELGTTFLHYACSKQDSLSENSMGPIKILIAAGANIFSQDSDGLTPFDYAKIKNNRINQAILKKEFLLFKQRYDNAKENVNNINLGLALLDTPENTALVQESRTLAKLQRENPHIKSGRELNEQEQKMLTQFSQIKTVFSKNEYDRFAQTIEKFEKLNLIWNGQ